MDISEELTCLFTAEVEEHGQSYVLEVPKQEVDVGYVDPTEDYQVALVGTAEAFTTRSSESSDTHDQQPETDQPPVSKRRNSGCRISELGGSRRWSCSRRAWFRRNHS